MSGAVIIAGLLVIFLLGVVIDFGRDRPAGNVAEAVSSPSIEPDVLEPPLDQPAWMKIADGAPQLNPVLVGNAGTASSADLHEVPLPRVVTVPPPRVSTVLDPGGQGEPEPAADAAPAPRVSSVTLAAERRHGRSRRRALAIAGGCAVAAWLVLR